MINCVAYDYRIRPYLMAIKTPNRSKLDQFKNMKSNNFDDVIITTAGVHFSSQFRDDSHFRESFLHFDEHYNVIIYYTLIKYIIIVVDQQPNLILRQTSTNRFPTNSWLSQYTSSHTITMRYYYFWIAFQKYYNRCTCNIEMKTTKNVRVSSLILYNILPTDTGGRFSLYSCTLTVRI